MTQVYPWERYVDQIRTGMTRQEALEKLLQHGPEDLNELTRITGWPEHETQMVVLQLIAGGKVRCLRSSGRERYALRVEGATRRGTAGDQHGKR